MGHRQITDPGGGAGGGGGSGLVLPQSGGLRLRGDSEIVSAPGLLMTPYPRQNRVVLGPGFAGEAQGDLAYRGAAGWQRLPAGTLGQALRSGGPSGDPSWASLTRSWSFLAPSAPVPWAVPLLATEFLGLTLARTKADLTTTSRARLVVRVVTPGLAGSELRAQYSTDESSWSYLDGAAGPAASLAAAGTATAGWVSLAAGAQADVFLRVVGINGNGIVTPTLGVVSLEVA